MTKIQRILTNTRMTEVNGLTQQMTDEYSKGDYSADSYITEIFDTLMDINQQLGTAIMRNKAESELSVLDDITDNEVTHTHGLVEGLTHHPNESIANKAITLFKMVDKYGLEVKTKGFNEEYPLLGSMIGESKTEPFASCIAQLDGCAERFNRLEAAVDNFNTKRNAFLLVKDDEKEQVSATEIKKQLIAFINNDIATYLNAMQKARPDDYSNLAQFIANRINENNSAVRLRRNKVEINE